jgi:hypothetical protein
MSFTPSWEPVNLSITVRDDNPNAPLLVVDGNSFRVECQAVRVEEMDDDNRPGYPPSSGLGASVELVDRIREACNGVFLAEPKFSDLYSFLRGYQEALKDHRIAWNDDVISFLDFQTWVKRRLNREDKSVDWSWAIKLRYSDDEEAYRRFFELWQEYRVQKNLQRAANAGQPQSPPSADQPAADGLA